MFDAGEDEALRPCFEKFLALGLLPLLVKGPAAFFAFALLATNFSTLLLISSLNVVFKSDHYERHFFKQLRRKSDRLIGLPQQTHVLKLALDQTVNDL